MPRAARVPAPKTPPLKRGHPLPETWQARFLERYKTKGGLWRSAEAAGVSHDTVRRYRAQDPVFDAQIRDAREHFADTVEEAMLDQAANSGNPVGYIVRLKALRPAEYIEKHAVLSLNVTAELASHDATALLSDLLAHTTDSTRRLLASAPRALPYDAAPGTLVRPLTADDMDHDRVIVAPDPPDSPDPQYSGSASLAPPQTLEADDDW